jgi:hypothetical protein
VRRYVGEWREGVQNGYGVLQTAAGERWEGAWRGGLRHGRGVAVRADGSAAPQAWEAGRAVPSASEPAEQRAGAVAIRRGASPPCTILVPAEGASGRTTHAHASHTLCSVTQTCAVAEIR